MAPDPAREEFTIQELGRGMARIEAALGKLAERVDTRYVNREVWDGAWKAQGDQNHHVANELVNLDAAVSRHIRDNTEREAALREHIETRVSAERADRISGQRWALGLSITGILGVIGALLSLLSAVAR